LRTSTCAARYAQGPVKPVRALVHDIQSKVIDGLARNRMRGNAAPIVANSQSKTVGKIFESDFDERGIGMPERIGGCFSRHKIEFIPGDGKQWLNNPISHDTKLRG